MSLNLTYWSKYPVRWWIGKPFPKSYCRLEAVCCRCDLVVSLVVGLLLSTPVYRTNEKQQQLEEPKQKPYRRQASKHIYSFWYPNQVDHLNMQEQINTFNQCFYFYISNMQDAFSTLKNHHFPTKTLAFLGKQWVGKI